MVAIEWERLLETLYHENSNDMLFVPGSPPMVRKPDAWRSLQVPPLTAEQIELMANDRLGPTPETVPEDGYAYAFFWHQDKALFRGIGFGYPSTKAFIISRCTKTGPPPAVSQAANNV